MSDDGFYDIDFKIIVINAKYKNTRRGARALAHEYAHFKDKEAGKFHEFFHHQIKKYNEKRMKEVIGAEQSAGIGAAKILLEYGKKYNPEETNAKKLPALMKFWKKYYFS